MAEDRLSQIVKGAPTASASIPQVAASVASNPPTSALAAAVRESHKSISPRSSTNSRSNLPNSAPETYVNLLILEASLRAQYISLRTRRRQHTFFLLLLGLWIAYFTWALFWRPREDGLGRGGSVYWVLDMYEKVSFLGGIITAILVWVTGQWERGVRWPRRWLGVTNRGLRTIHLKLVVIRGPWWKQVSSWVTYILPHSSFFISPGSSYRYVPVDLETNTPEPTNDTTTEKPTTRRSSIITTRRHASVEYREEDLAPGGDHVKLLLLPKPFELEFRQNWDTYRNEYWEAENARRAELRRALRKQQFDRARAEGGWLWWAKGRTLRLAFSRGGLPAPPYTYHTEKSHKSSSSKCGRGDTQGSSSRRARPRHRLMETTNSRSSSMSSNATTGTPDPDDREFDRERERRSQRPRRSSRTSTSGSTSGMRRSRLTPADGDEQESMSFGARRPRNWPRDADESDSTGTQGSEGMGPAGKTHGIRGSEGVIVSVTEEVAEEDDG